MRIRKLYLKDIGPFDEVEFEFKPQEEGKAEIHILTGPNGSGKTTVLHAIASIFTDSDPFRNPNANNAFIKRFHSSRVEQSTCLTRLRASFDRGLDIEVQVAERVAPFPRLIDFGSFYSNENIKLYRQNKLMLYANDFFVAAYSGYRKKSHSSVNAIQELNINPFEEALTFDKSAKANFDNNQWIANSISKRAIEKEKNNPEQANKFASSMTIMEKAISLIADYDIKFDLKTSPLSLIATTGEADLDFDVLPDGLQSAIGWIGDLLMRLDLINWSNDLPVNEQSLILFLDEIEVHLHPAWQRKVLPAVQKLFPNAQIFLSTHSPFVVNSIDGAAIYELKVEAGKAYLGEVTESKSSASYRSVLREVFDIEKPFGGQTQDELDKFQQQRDQILRGEIVNEKDFLRRGRKLAKQSEELLSIISIEIKQINNIKGTNYEL